MADIERWITVNGVHVPIMHGEKAEDAIKKHFANNAKDSTDSKQKQIAQNKSEGDKKNAVKEQPKYKDAKDFEQFKKDNFETIKTELRTTDKHMEDIKSEWRNIRHAEISKNENLHEMNYSEMENADSDFRQSAYTGWFRDANSDYKPELADTIFSSDKEFNIGMNIGYFHYRVKQDEYSFLYDKWKTNNAKSFKEWLDTPMTLYRGSTESKKLVDSDVFVAYTPDKAVAEKFGNFAGGRIDTIQITPRETWGAYNMTGEQEYWIPRTWLNKHKK